MEVENTISSTLIISSKDEDDVPLPGFRFHPTDEELVGFYLRRKVEKKPLRIELIKHADIYKYDPWDLPKSSNAGDKEWYFFCKRGRKYRNSIRPNRVTGSGFWKATGIDRPIYPSVGAGRDCIGLKKSLVYYRGSAGKGTKTDWMMHEFRLPPSTPDKTTKNMDAKTIAQEAEVWTLCRILKRNNSYRKLMPDWRELAIKRSTINPLIDASSKTCSVESSDKNSYISFTPPVISHEIEKKPYPYNVNYIANQQFLGQFSSSSVKSQDLSITSSSSMCGDINELLRSADWEDLQSIVDCAAAAATTTTAATTNSFYL